MKKKYFTSIFDAKKVQMPFLILALLLSRLSLAQQPCFTNAKFPKMTNGNNGESWGYSLVGSASLNAIFQGGAMQAPNLENDQTTVAFITKVSLANNMVQWRRIYDISAGTDMNVITAMAISPDTTKLAVYGTFLGPNFANNFWLWTVNTSDGGHDSDALQYTLGPVGTSEHVVFDDGIIFTSTKIFLAFLQVSPTLRKNLNKDLEGKMALGSYDIATQKMDWVKENSMFGYSAALVYKNYGAAQANLFVGGALD